MQEIFLQGQKLSTSGLLLETRLSYMCYILHAKYFVQAILPAGGGGDAIS